MLRTKLAAICILLKLLTVPVFGQHAPAIANHAENMDFLAGNIGDHPPGWNLGSKRHTYVARTETSCHRSPRCGAILSTQAEQQGDFSFLYQIVDAKPHRGKKFRFRAAVRIETPAPSGLTRLFPTVARLLVRIHDVEGGTLLRDNMANTPINATTWAFYEITGAVAMNARDVEFGVQLFGEGVARIDQISLEFMD